MIGARCADLIAEAVQWNLKHLLKIFQECLMHPTLRSNKRSSFSSN
jgi:hypothetical protein